MMGPTANRWPLDPAGTPYPYPAVDEITLQPVMVGVQMRLGQYVEGSMRFAVDHADRARGELVARLTAEVLSQRVPVGPITQRRTWQFKVPASPWQAFKADHASTWWLRWLVQHRPVRHHIEHRSGELTVNVDAYVTWPEAQIMPEKFGRPVRVLVPREQVQWTP